MAETTKKAASKPRAKKTPADSVVVVRTATNEPLIIRANPTDEAVKGFVEEHMRRHTAGLKDGPGGIPAQRIHTAHRFASEEAFLSGADPIAEVDVAEHLL